MNILFYTPTNAVSRDLESLAVEASKHGHLIFLLVQNEDGPLGDIFRKYGFKVQTAKQHREPGLMSMLPLMIELISFCKKHKIDIVYSYLEPTNLIAVLSQYFTRAKMLIYRHHTDAAHLDGFDRSLAYRLTYKLARRIIVVSEKARAYMIAKEHVRASKVHHIDLGYDFNVFEIPGVDDRIVQQIREKHHGKTILLCVGRLTAYKRAHLAVMLLRTLLDHDHNFHLIILGEGEEKTSIVNAILAFEMTNHVTMAGYVPNILPYLAASDFLVHPSISESSCVTVKEAGLMERPVIVCKDVGDFDDIISHGVSGWTVDRNEFVKQAAAVILAQRENAESNSSIGKKLKEKVINHFSIKRTYTLHKQFYQSGR